MTDELFTYPEVGATSGDLPMGYHHMRESAVVGSGRADFERAADIVMTWEMHRRAGLTVRAAGSCVRVGENAAFTFGPVAVPVRVVYVVDELHRRGFAYGTRHGHPECGEERFVVNYNEDTEQVRLDIVAFSKPGTWWVRLGAPIGWLVQSWVTRRYLEAVIVKDSAR